jgi:hypothetical protein
MKNRKSYFWPIVILIVVFYSMADFLARTSSAFFLPVDRMLFISPSLSPVTMWAFLGMLLGAVYGCFVSIRKFRLDNKLIVIPIGILIVWINLMLLLS